MTITPQADDGSSKQQVDAEACFAWASNSSNMTRPRDAFGWGGKNGKPHGSPGVCAGFNFRTARQQMKLFFGSKCTARDKQPPRVTKSSHHHEWTAFF
jgi:hypothetical protein